MISSKEKRPDFFTKRIRLWGLAIGAGVVGSIATVFSFLGSLGWFLDLFSHFRVQYFLGLTVVALLLLIPRQRKASACFGLVAVVNLCTILPLYWGRSGETASTATVYRAVLINVNTRFGNVNRVTEIIHEYDPDIVVLEEVSARWVSGLQGLSSSYAYSKIESREDNFGIALYSKLPFDQCDIVYIGEAEIPSVVAEIKTPSGRLRVIATHPLPPTGARYSLFRNSQLAAIPEVVKQSKSPVLLLGDLNVTPWSPHFKRLLTVTELRDSSQGRGVQPTWPTNNPLFLIPIDHCLHSPDITIERKEIGPSVGSDHYPIVVDFVIPSGKVKNGPTTASRGRAEVARR